MEDLKLPHGVERIVGDFVKGVSRVYGENLVSVILYGSAASGEYTDKHSNVNIAIVLKDASLRSLSRISRLLNKNKFVTINPIFFTEDYIRRSTDVFPIEFLDMKENHVVLYGHDFLKDISIDIKNLRFQCEQELKSKILNIKKIYLTSRNKFILKSLLFKSLTSSLHVLRNLVRLKGKIPPYTKEGVLKDVTQEFGIDTADLRKILDAKNKNLKLSLQEVDALFGRLVETLEKISDKVDIF